MEWEREDGYSCASVGTTHLVAEQWLGRPDLWAAYVSMSTLTIRGGHYKDVAFHSREEAEVAAVELLVKHVKDMAAIIGYKVVKEQE